MAEENQQNNTIEIQDISTGSVNVETDSESDVMSFEKEIVSAEADDSDEKNNSSDPDKPLQGTSAFTELFTLYLGPLLIIVFCIVLVFGVTVPVLNTLFGNINQIQQYAEEYDSLQSRLAVRQKLSAETNTQQEYIDLIDDLIPLKQTAVADFSNQIREQAAKNRLTLRDSVVGEVVVVSNTEGKTGPGSDTGATTDLAGLELMELPAEFSLSGSLANIRTFLSDLYEGEDFIIIKKLELQKQITTLPSTTAGETSEGNSAGDTSRFSTQNSNTWIMSIVLVKYQFRQAAGSETSDLTIYYFSVPDTLRPDQNVLDFLDETYGE